MAWTWRCSAADGSVVTDAVEQSFESRSDAESWLGEYYADLLEEGVSSVVLLDGETQVYGPMGLEPAE